MADAIMKVAFRGQEYPIALDDNLTCDQLGQLLGQAAHVQLDTIKLLVPGRKGAAFKLADTPTTSVTSAGGVGTLTDAGFVLGHSGCNWINVLTR